MMKHPISHSSRSSSARFFLGLWLAATVAVGGTLAAGPKLVEIRRMPEGHFRVKLQSADTERYTLQVSPDLTHWIPLYGQVVTEGAAEFMDFRGPEFASLYYRAASARADELANPLAVQIQPDPLVSATGLVSTAGGSLSFTNASGIVVELTIPEGALESSTSIRLTQVKQVGGLPFSGGLLAAVQMEPEGLKLKTPATLKMRLTSPPALSQLVAFGYRSLGQNFHLLTDSTTGSVATIYISHFSGVGLGLGTTADASALNARMPENPVDRFEAALAFIQLQIRRQGVVPTSAQLAALEELHRQFYLSVLDPTWRAARGTPEFLGEAGSASALWKTRIDQNGLTTQLQALIADGQRLLSEAVLTSNELRSGWRRLDANKDGRADATDGRMIFAQGIWKPTTDVNGDGKLDIQDWWAWALFISQWDVTGDRSVSSEDFRPITQVSLPAPDSKIRDGIVQSALNPIPRGLPLDYETKMMAKLTNSPPENHAKSQILVQGGIAALIQHDLESARWSFARACQLDPTNYTALANLGFVLSAEGRLQEALRLIAEALALEPTCAAAWNNLGVIQAQHGQFADAVKSCDRAIQYAPFVGQYQLSKAVVLLQSGAKGAAAVAAAAAARLSPGDSEAQMFNQAIRPPNPGQLSALQAEYEQYRQEEGKAQGVLPPAWSQMTFGEQASAIYNLPDYQFEKQLEAELQALSDQIMELARKEFDKIRAKGVSAKEDITIFFDHFPSTAEKLIQLEDRAKIEATYLARASERKKSGARLAMDKVVLQLALAQAQIDMSGVADVNEARKVFEEDIDLLYEEPMRDAAQRLRRPTDTAGISLPRPEYGDMLQWSGGLGFIAITLGGVADPEGYGKGFAAPTKQLDPIPAPAAEGSVGLSLAGGLVQGEWNATTGEEKIQVGEGLIVAGTWHPKNGYGFQVGLGVDIQLGSIVSASTGTFLKFGSDGSVTSSTEAAVGASAGPVGTKLTANVDNVLVASTHPPVVSLSDLLPP